MRSRAGGLLLPPIVAMIVLLAAWQTITVALGIPAYLLPSPWEVAAGAAAHASTLLGGTALTAGSVLLGFAASAVLGFAVGVSLSVSPWTERAFFPFTVFLQTVPLIAIAPMLVVWFGYGWPAVTASACIASIFPVIANTVAGLRATDPELRELLRLLGAGPMATLWKLRLPWALPSIFTGLRVASGLAVAGGIVGEFVASFTGGTLPLGAQITTYVRGFQTDLVFAAVVLASLLGLALFGAVNLASWLVLRRWYAGASAR